MKQISYRYTLLLAVLSCLLGMFAPVFANEYTSLPLGKVQDATKTPGTEKKQNLAPDILSPKIKTFVKDKDNDKDEVKVPEVPIENVVPVTSEQLANKAQDYLNKNVKFTAPFFAFSNLALDYKPAFRSSRTYLSFLILRPNSKTPFSEIKLDMLVPKEKDPLTKMLGTLREGDIIEITGHVFACPLDEPWLDVLRLKRIASTKSSESAEDKLADDKDSTDDQSTEDKKK